MKAHDEVVVSSPLSVCPRKEVADNPSGMESVPHVEVDLILESMRLTGVLVGDPSKRVSDLLNVPSDSILLRGVTVKTLEGSRLESFPELTVEKRHLLAVIPQESAEYLYSRRAQRFGVARPDLTSIPAGLVLPPFTGQGILWMPPPSSPIALARLSHFFALTEAVLYQNRLAVVKSPALLVNKDHVVGIGALEEVGPGMGSEAATRAGSMGAGENLNDLWRRLQSGQSSN